MKRLGTLITFAPTSYRVGATLAVALGRWEANFDHPFLDAYWPPLAASCLGDRYAQSRQHHSRRRGQVKRVQVFIR